MTRVDGRASRSSTGRKRGGQPGNKNNLRHGFYSKLFTAEDSQRLDGEINILDDLKAMRIKAYRLFKLTTLKKIDEKEIRAFYCLARALQFINTAERTLLLTRGHGGQIGQDILAALRELNPDEEL